jgi:hypothetical protein
MAWHSWVALLGGVIALIGQWWGMSYWLPAIGGILAIIAGIAMMMNH